MPVKIAVIISLLRQEWERVIALLLKQDCGEDFRGDVSILTYEMR